MGKHIPTLWDFTVSDVLGQSSIRRHRRVENLKKVKPLPCSSVVPKTKNNEGINNNDNRTQNLTYQPSQQVPIQKSDTDEDTDEVLPDTTGNRTIIEGETSEATDTVPQTGFEYDGQTGF